jgi:hypothetical protein
VDCSSRPGPAIYLHRSRGADFGSESGHDFARTPTDIFPNINIPVISVGWQFTGMNPEELEGRLTGPYERILTTTVDNVEHIESTTVNVPILQLGLSGNGLSEQQLNDLGQNFLRPSWLQCRGPSFLSFMAGSNARS